MSARSCSHSSRVKERYGETACSLPTISAMALQRYGGLKHRAHRDGTERTEHEQSDGRNHEENEGRGRKNEPPRRHGRQECSPQEAVIGKADTAPSVITQPVEKPQSRWCVEAGE